MCKNVLHILLVFLICGLTLCKDCDTYSNVIAIDNVLNDKLTYDLLVSISTKDDCKIKCKIENDDEIKIDPTDNYSFSKRYYSFFRLNSLKQQKEYKYYCGDEDKNDHSYSTISFPQKLSETRIAAFGDWSKCDAGEKTLNYLKENITKYDSIIMLGDLAYDLLDENGKVGNKFMKFITPVTSKLPYMLSAGNHENKKNYEDYIKRFQMPLKKENKNMYFSFDINNAHFVSVTSDFGLDQGDMKPEDVTKFINWLKNDLEKSKAKWKIVYMHRPLYCSLDKNRCTKEAESLRSFFEDIFYNNKVDLVIAGHLHNYERFYPVYKSQVDKSVVKDSEYINPNYPVHVICGSAGNSEGQTDKCKIIFK
jgi:hypothetical protein